MRFRTTLLQIGNNVGIEVPQTVIDGLGAGKKPAVTVDINGTYGYRSTVAVMGGKYLIAFNSAHRAASGFSGGDEVEVTLELDTAPRIVEVPEALAAALAQNPGAEEAFDKLSNSKKQLHALPVADAKTEETRARRVAKSIEVLGA